ncbi:hypothetical protein ACIA8G_40185 [Lentzea sp. NPDC051213]|uniref:hypothetical protein n=1 Tax=Lentzea sp. NPDC051213 TaxID=3364126 RepID=UPI003793A058
MAISRWARRAVLTATALAVALPFTTGTAQADPIIQVLADNNVNLTVGASNNNVNSIPVSLNAGASLNTGSGITLDTNEGIQLALDIGHAEIWADASVGVPFTDIGVEASAAASVDAPAVTIAVEHAEVGVTADTTANVDVSVNIAAPPAEPEVAALQAAPILEAAVTITDETAATPETIADESKGDEEEVPDEAGPSGCPNITVGSLLSACLLPNLLQLHI